MVTMRPAIGRWAEMASVFAASRPAAAIEFRAQLGLPEGVVVMSGHQAELWHAGILAKAMAAEHVAVKAGGRAAWVVVDQDSNEPCRVPYPAVNADGRLAGAVWTLSDDLQSATTDVPTGSRGAVRKVKRVFPKPAATGPVAVALAAAADALDARGGEASLARQFAWAAFDLVREALPTPALCYASEIARTSLWQRVLDRIDADPAACVASYNRAVAATPEAGLAPLNAAKLELPLWKLSPGEPRGRVMASTLGRHPRENLVPRAILMTGLLRHAGCDLFVHGLGGGAYDQAAERWLAEWLGWKLAPMTVATATLLLPLSEGPLASEAEAARAVWTAHHARHSPGLVGDSWAARRKAELLDEIRGVKVRGGDPSPLFDEMHRLLAGVRKEHANEIAALAAKATAMTDGLAATRVANDRTFPAALHNKTALARLRDVISGS